MRLPSITGSLAIAILSSWSRLASAQPAYMVADLGDEILFGHEQWFGPWVEHTTAGDKHYFFQDDGIHGRELWRTDGSPLGTFMIRDLCPGSCGSRYGNFGQMAALGDRLVFGANDGVHGVEIWLTDGTALGTTLIGDLTPGYRSSRIRTLTSAADQVFFVASSDGDRETLWRTDGTTKGTYPITPPGPAANFSPSSIHPGPGFLYLCNANWSGSEGLWRTDGTSSGTQFVAAVACWQNALGKWAPMSVSSSGVLLFQGTAAGSNDMELWRSDGTPNGTFLVKNLDDGPSGTYPTNFAWLDDELLFEASGNLWRTDGTASGTEPIPLADAARPAISFGSWAVAGSRYFFPASDPEHGAELWSYDGVSAQRVLDLRPGPDSSMSFDLASYSIALFEPFGNDVLFTADDGAWGREVWRSDGTIVGTVRISDVAPGAASLQLPFWWANYSSSLGGRPVFVAYQADVGDQLWRVDETGTATELVRGIRSQASLFETRATDRNSLFEADRGRDCFEGAGASLFFERISRASGSVDLFRSDGSLSGPEPVLLDLPWQPIDCGSRGEKLLYSRGIAPSPPSDHELLAVDGPTGVPAVLLASEGLSWTIPPFLAVDDQRYFIGGSTLFSTDATPEGTEPVALDVEPYGARLEPFQDEVAIAGTSLWLTDPTEATGARVLLQGDGELWVLPQVAALTNHLVFPASDPTHGTELWASDGTAEGTSLLADFNPGPAPLLRDVSIDLYHEYRDAKIVSIGPLAVFAGLSPTGDEELWVTNGTPLGTYRLRDIYIGDYPSTPRQFARFGDRIIFTAESELEGLELWATDGTYDGTVLVKDIAPGAASSIPDDLVVREGVLYFSAWSPNYGREAWKSDGTAAGTIRISDIAPGSKSSSPQRFARAGNRLYFSATDHVHGYELWAISDDGGIPIFLDGFESADTGRWGDTEP